MADASDTRRIALSLEGTIEYPHFDRVAFKVRRTYATLAADGRTLNLKLTPDEQEFKCLLRPDAFAALANGWGRQGWTMATLAPLAEAELRAALVMAWEHGRATTARPRSRSAPAQPVRGRGKPKSA